VSTVVNLGWRTAGLVRKALSWLGIALLVLLGLLGPRAVMLAQVAVWHVVSSGPPLTFDLPRNGQVVAHVMGHPPLVDIARIRISDVSSGATVWDVKPTTAKSECWNRCWNLTLKAGSNSASFAAGRQQFNASVPQDQAFFLAPGTTYLFEVWDNKGRVAHHQFTL
jgi:hypothetical protein